MKQIENLKKEDILNKIEFENSRLFRDDEIRQSTWSTSQHMQTDTFEINLYKDTSFSSVKFHSHDFYELYLFLNGSAVYTVENGDYELMSGDIILIPPNHLHRVEITDKSLLYERFVFWLNPNYLNKLSTPKTKLEKVFLDCGKSKNYLVRDTKFSKVIKQKLIDLHKSKESNDFGNDIEIQIIIKSLLLELSRYLISQTYTSKAPTINKMVNDTIKYINENINKPLSLDMLSRDLYISKYYLARLFKKNTGTSPHQFIIKKRLALSKNLLAKGISIKEACVQVGFGDYTHYFRAFKKEFGITPKQYLNFLQNKK